MTESVQRIYSIGTVGTPWGAAERALWLSQQPVKRSYQAEVLAPLQQLLTAPALAGLTREIRAAAAKVLIAP